MSVGMEQLLTASDYWHLPDNGMQRALVRGEVVETMPPGGRHGVIAALLISLLLLWTRTGARGVVGVESGFVLARKPDTVRAPDVFYVRPSRIPANGVPVAFWEIAPDLAVEVVSPTESAEEIREKVRDYLAAGTSLVWVVYPGTEEVVVHTPDGLARTLGVDDTLSAPDALPGFSCGVAELFATA